jgi:hypothetical protein
MGNIYPSLTDLLLYSNLTDRRSVHISRSSFPHSCDLVSHLQTQIQELGKLRAIMKMYADFTGTLERIKERVAEDEARRRTAADRESQVLMERERRKADRRKEASTGDKKYADSIERRVREAKTNQDQTEGTNEVES